MAEIILPPEENEETPQAPELNIDKPTTNSKVITIEFEAKKTNKVSTKDTNQQLYTTDTDAWFEFKETSLEGANGTYSVVFRNRHDGSIFQRTGDVVNGVAYYKIPHQEIRHAGAWRGQIVYTLSNGDTTSREFGYDVKGHILDGKDVREIVVEDFETLMAQLRSMKDNAESELASLVNTANQNETDRQVFFDDLVEDIDDLQANYQELLDTGVLQTNINTKLEQLEEEYAPKLTEVTAQLAHDVRKKNVPITEFDISDTLKQQINGNAPINQTLADKVVTPEKTTFFKTGKNIFNKNTIIPNHNIDQLDGSIVETPYQIGVSDFIRVEPNTDYFTAYDGRRVFYDENKEIIEVVSPESVAPKSFKTPSNAFYMRTVVADSVLEYAQIEKGTERTYYEPYREYIPEEALKLNLQTDQLENLSVTPDKTSFFVRGKNLFNKETATAKQFESVNTPLPFTVQSDIYHVSDYIPVEPNREYTRNYNYTVVFYNKDKVIIKGIIDIENETITTPVGCYFIRVQVVNHRLSDYQIEEGNIQTPYEPFSIKIKPEFLSATSGNGGDTSTELFQLLNDVTDDSESYELATQNLPYAYIQVPKCTRADITLLGTNDDVEWGEIPVTSIETGNIFPRVHNPGIWSADVQLYSKVKVALKVRPSGRGSASIKFVSIKPETKSNSINVPTFKQPSPAIPESELYRNVNAAQVCATPYLPDGVMYANSGRALRKSVDGGKTFTDLAIFQSSVKRTWKTKNGNILVFTSDGETYSYDEESDTSTLVHSFETSSAELSGTLGGLHVYENYVFAAEYGPNNVPDNPRRAYMSKDYGMTWEKIYEGPLIADLETKTYHIHAIQYDPYENIVWIVDGDGYTNSNVHWSKDLGKTWNKVYEDGYCPNQFTTVYALPNCVLFGSDNRNTGYWRYDRKKNGISSGDVIIEQALELYRHFLIDEPIATQAVVTYDENPALYFSYYFRRDDGTDILPSVLATSDGYTFHTIYTAPEPSDGTNNTFIGLSLSGLTQDDYLIANWLHRPMGQLSGTNLIKIKRPDWD